MHVLAVSGPGTYMVMGVALSHERFTACCMRQTKHSSCVHTQSHDQFLQHMMLQICSPSCDEQHKMLIANAQLTCVL